MLSKRLSLVVAILAATSGCADPAAVIVDLGDTLELAEFQPETGVIDVGKPEARALLEDGWLDYDEQWAGGPIDFVWGIGGRSRLRFWSFSPGTRRFRLVGRPVPQDGTETCQVSVVLNGNRIERLTLGPGFHEYVVEVPEDAMRAGTNVLDLYYSYADGTVPAARERAVAWDRIRVGRRWAYGAPASAPGTEGRTELTLPFFSRLNYYVEVGPGAALELDRLRVHGTQVREAETTLRIKFETEAGDSFERTIAAADFASGQSLDLNVEATTIGTLSLQAEVAYQPRQESGIRLYGARLRVPPAATATPAESGTAAALPAAPRPPNVLVYLIDTLRADHLGLYGYPLDTSPRIDAFAAEAITFDHAYTQSSWTRSSVASIFTGLVPATHRVLERSDSLPAEATTIAAEFQSLGYQTFGITTNGNVSRHFGFDRGFDTYLHMSERRTVEIHQPSEAVNERFFGWFDDESNEQPFFVYLHSSDPHGPYAPRSPFREMFPSPGYTDVAQPHLIDEALEANPSLTLEQIREEFISGYNGEIAYNDHSFGELLDGLRERDVYDDTIIVLVADHGEEFLDHGRWAHGSTLFTENIRTPLLVKLPNQHNGGARTSALTQHIDLLPTLLRLVGGPVPSGLQGYDQVPTLMSPSDAQGAPWVRSYLKLDRRELSSLITRGMHVIRPQMLPPTVTGAGVHLYDLEADLPEQNNLSGRLPHTSGYMLAQFALLESMDMSSMTAGTAVIDEALAERLRALGYVQ